MKILVLNTDYPDFLKQHHDAYPELSSLTYAQQMQARNDSLFGTADFYSHNLRLAGCDAWDVHVNNEVLQRRWAAEHGLALAKPVFDVRRLARHVPGLRRRFRRKPPAESWYLDILAAQIDHYDPDVILNQDTYTIPSHFLATMAGRRRLVVGQIASPLPQNVDWRGYDLMLSSLPNLIEEFQRRGVAAEFSPLGFEARILNKVDASPVRDLPLVFIGSFTGDHRTRIELLEFLSLHTDIAVFGSGLAALSRSSPIRGRMAGESWGADMYRLLGRSLIALNQHIDMAGSFANNCRLFEATGMGALLLTDRKINLGDYFELGREAVAYDSPQDCLRQINRLRSNPEEASRIAQAGQARTLSSHTYDKRMAQFAELVERHLRRKRMAG